MLDFITWAARHPQAAQELQQVIAPGFGLPAEHVGKDEAFAQQQIRFAFAREGGMLWRNNVGATRAAENVTCPKCSFKFVKKQQPVRYGLANESPQQNKLIKSADLIGCKPVIITPQHVGTTIGQFWSIEAKRPGWVFNPKDEHQAGQAAWITLIQRLGGVAKFSTGVL